MKKVLLSLAMAVALMAPTALQAKVKHLLPKPQQVTVNEATTPFALGGSVTISYNGGAAKCELLEEFFTQNGCTLGQGGTTVRVDIVESIDGAHDYELYGYENEAYILNVTSSGITISAVTNTGVIRAAQTLVQMAEGWDGAAALEAVTVKDWPAFKVRGYMHDVGRSFISADELVKQVEKFSRFKVNTFHWHMTENQAWRFEVKAYPELTSSESMTRFPGQYYTQEDCKRVMEAAKKHGVIVIPEIDMPGHSEAFERAMGFNMQTEQGKTVLKKVLDEVVEVFAGAPYIHIGGDEVSTTAAYLNEMIAYAESKGANVKGGLWNPINGIGQDALNHSLAQMWGTRGYLASGKANIDCRYNYTNHFDVFADLVGIYKSNIYYHEKGTSEVAGSISGCWNDRKVATEKDIMAQNNVWANVIATAERTWIGGGKQYIDNMTNTPANLKADGGHGGVMLPNSGDEYEEFKSWEERFLFHKANSLKGEPIPYVKQTNVRWRITDAFPNGGSETAAFGPETAGMTASTDLLPEVFSHDGKTYYTGMATGAGIYLAHTWGNSIIDAYYSNPQFNHTAYAWTYVYSDKEQKVGAQIEFQNYSRSEQDGAAPAGKWDHFGSKIWINGAEIAAPTWDNTGVSISSKEVMLKNENFPGRKPIQVTLKQGWNKVFMKLPYFNKGYRLKKWMFTCVFTDTEGVNAVDGLIYSPNQCMDEATEAVAAEISNIKRNRGNYIGTAVGLWPESTAATLDAKVAEIEATYSVSKTADERAAQVTALAEAWSAFAASLTEANMNQPVSGNYYRMYTPLRGNRYATGNGADAAITGPTEATTKASIWRFVSRGENVYDIINVADGTYISPASNNNAALKTVSAQPNAGWSIKKAENTGNVIVVSGSAQFNQQKDGNLYLLNWGSGTNTADDGCEYRIVDVTDQIPPQPIVSVVGVNNETYPYTVDANLAAKVFAQENITIALDVVMPASLANNTRYALVCAADPTQGITGATKTNSPYVAYGLNGSNPVYLPSSASGDKFTYRDFAFAGNTTYKVVYVVDKTNKQFSIYVDGALKSTATYPVIEYELQSFSNFASNANAKLYIGGGVVSSNAQYDKFGGAIHSVQFFDEALTTEKIALIKYPLTQDQQNELRVVEKLYRPTKRVTVLESGKKYMIYDTAEGRTGFIKNAGTSLGHSGTNAQSKPGTFSGDESYIWTVSAADAANYKYYLKASNGKYVNATGNTENATGQDIYIQPWKTSTATKSESNSESEEGTITPNAEIGEGVWTISGSKVGNNGQNCWNGNSGSWAKWSNCHPYALYDYELQASIEIPQNALTYYIAADALQSDGSYAKHYLYNNNGTLATSPNFVRDDAKYMWTATVDANGNYTFANGAGQYLGYGASGSGLCMAASPVSLNISKENAVHGGSLGMYRIRPEGDADGQWMVTKVNGTSFNRNSAKVNNGSWCSDYTFTYVNSGDRMLTIVSNVPNVEAIYSWNGEEFDLVTQLEGNAEVTDATLNCVSCNTAYTFDGFYSDEQFTQQITEVAELEDDMTVYAKFTLNIFSENYGEKWVSVIRATNAAHAMILTDGAANTVPVYNMLDYANEGILWNFVGTAENFKIYNKVSGDALALTPNATPADGVTVKMVAATEAQNWHLIQYADGYAIAPVDNNAWGLNSYGNVAGNQVKFYGVADGGTHWNFLLQNLLSAKAEVEGWNENNPNTHFGSIKIVNGSNSALAKLKMENTAVSNIVYNGADVTIEFARAYRGFEFQGYRVGNTDLGENFTLTEEIKAQITEKNPLVAKFTTTDDVTLFYDDDPFSYRIPAIGKTSTGRLIAVSDYRYSLDDIGRYNFGTANPGIDLVMRYSDDNGKTWSETKTIAKGSCVRGTDDCAYGDAAIAVVGQKVLVMGAAGDVMFGNGSATAHNRAIRIFSEDNGVTWAKQDISETLFLGDDATIKNGYSSFFGSGRLAVDENYNGTGKARIYGALLLKKASGTGNYVIYTDDLGLTWHILGGSQDPVATQDEPKVEILPSGQILLSVRRGGGRQFNVFTYTDKATNAGSWDSNVNGCGNGGSNTCNGEPFLVDALKANGEPVKLLMQSQPKGGGGLYDRRDVTIWYKEVTDATYTSAQIAADWTQGLQVSTQQSAYSAMALQDDGKIAFFFEEAPCYGDDQAKGYCMVYVPLTIEEITKNNYSTPEVQEDEVTSADALPGDGTLRFYRLAIPVTESAYEQDLESNNDKVKAFWQECEDFVNKMFIPLGFCFDVVVDDKLINVTDLTIGNSGLPEIGNCTYDLNDILGEANYDVAMWVTHRDDAEENSGLSALGGAYTSSQKGSGYAKTDKWVVAHELGHMFGAEHTLQGEGSLMDNLGDFFSYPSIKAIRNSAKGTVSYSNVKVANNAPQFDEEKMQQTYRIPQGACLAIEVQAADKEEHKLMYTAIGCNAQNVDNVQEGKDVTLPFASFAPQESNVISYSPIYTADLFYEDYFYVKEGTAIHEMEAGRYPLSILVNDVPSTGWTYAALTEQPFYSTYAIWETEVQIVEGEPFTATIASEKTSFTAGEKVTVQWGVNESYFTADSRLRVTMSDDYGKTFEYVLAESVEALSGECTVTMPNVEVGQVDVDFSTAVRKMNGGVIKVEEIGGAAFTMTVLDPNSDKGFTVDNTSVTSYIGAYKMGTFYANDPMTIPTGVTAYVATTLPVMNDGVGTIAMTAITDVIPAKTGVLLCAEEGEYVFRKAESEGTAVTGNMLYGYAGANEYEEVEKPEDGSANYVLAVEEDKVGFYKKDTGFKVYNNKAYLNLPSSVAKARAIYFDFGGETGILETENGEVKTENCYDLSGRRVKKTQNGVYIVNGVKVVK